MLLLDRKLIFIHIPKCAGTSIEVFFAGRDWAKIDPETKHITCQMAARIYGREVWDDCFKFSTVRNPWARLLSFFNLIRVVKPEIVFEDWIREVCSAEGLLFNGLPIHRSMCEYLTDPDGNLMVDFVGKVESLADDLAVIVEKAGSGVTSELPRTMVGHYNHDYRAWYTPETRELIAERFRDDIERFGYDY